jgi:molecular chaperone DnaK
MPQVEVSFDIDVNGIVTVSAKDKATNREQKVTIQGSSGLSQDEVQRMQREAETHAEEDRAKRESVELRNVADSTAYEAEKTLREHAERIEPALKTEVEEKIKAVRDALEANETEAMRPALDALSQSLQKIGAAIYAAQGDGATAGPTEAQPGTSDDEATVEGEFREV